MISNIDLEKNGRIFPSWIMKNFKKYILPKVIIIEGEDQCKDSLLDKLTLYQQFIGQYLNYQSPFKDLLIYHGAGSGKINTVINIYNILYNYTHKWNVFVLIPTSLHEDPWLIELKLWLDKNNYNQKLTTIIFIHYDSSLADKEFLKKIESTDKNKTSIFIIDDCHKFINNIYTNINSKKKKRTQIIYDYIQQEKIDKKNTRIILLSSTPVINIPFELSLIFNLLRPDILPSSENNFDQLFLSDSSYTSLNENNKNMFQRRIIGLVSYYVGGTPDKFARKIIHHILIPMDSYQEEIYDYFENIEKNKEIIALKIALKNTLQSGKKDSGKDMKNNDISTYSSHTRQACNFVFPNISNDINGEKKLISSSFKNSKLILLDDNIKQNPELLKYIKDNNKYINALIEYLNNIHKSDKNYTILNDIDTFKNTYNFNFDNFYNSNNKKSNLLKELYKYSPKFIKIIFNILNTKGTVLIYSNYIIMEGLQILKIYLSFFGFINIEFDKDFNKNKLDTNNYKYDYCRYCEFHRNIEKENKLINKDLFNNKNNKYGKYCKIFMISSDEIESINLSNIRQIHIIEPYWNEVRIEQVINRAIRLCHHKDLPINERIVDIYRYIMIKHNDKLTTTDQRLEKIAIKKQILLSSFIDAIKEVAIDCDLFKNHNMIEKEYKCFQFTEESLFLYPIESAYKKNINDDKKIDNGLNASNSIIKTVKVYKISAVLYISTNIYSSKKFYWFNDKTGIVYDYITNFPIGKILKDSNDNYKLLEENIFIIDDIINIPQFKLNE